MFAKWQIKKILDLHLTITYFCVHRKVHINQRDHNQTGIEKDDFELSPFVDDGGLGKFYQLFGSETEKIIVEINKELAA